MSYWWLLLLLGKAFNFCCGYLCRLLLLLLVVKAFVVSCNGCVFVLLLLLLLVFLVPTPPPPHFARVCLRRGRPSHALRRLQLPWHSHLREFKEKSPHARKEITKAKWRFLRVESVSGLMETMSQVRVEVIIL